MKVGDKVNLRFTEELALLVRKSDAQPSATQAEMVALAPKREKPAGLMARTVELTGSVESIDLKKRTVNKGDQVVLRYTESVALSVVKS